MIRYDCIIIKIIKLYLDLLKQQDLKSLCWPRKQHVHEISMQNNQKITK